MAGSPLVGAPGSRFRAINVYETRSSSAARIFRLTIADTPDEQRDNLWATEAILFDAARERIER